MDEHVDLPGRRADRQIRWPSGWNKIWWAATEPQHDNGRQMGIHPLYLYIYNNVYIYIYIYIKYITLYIFVHVLQYTYTYIYILHLYKYPICKEYNIHYCIYGDFHNMLIIYHNIEIGITSPNSNNT